MSIGPIVAALTGVPAGRIVDRFGTRPHDAGRARRHRGRRSRPVGRARDARHPRLRRCRSSSSPRATRSSRQPTTRPSCSDVGPDQRGVVSGTLSLSRNLGLVTGASVMGAVFALASGASDITAAPPAAVATGMRITFAVAAALIAVAIAVVASARGVRVRGLVDVHPIAWILALALPARSRRGTRPWLRAAQRRRREQPPTRWGSCSSSTPTTGPTGAPETDAFFAPPSSRRPARERLQQRPALHARRRVQRRRPRLLFLNVDYTIVPDWLTVRVGQFKRPFSRPFITLASQLSMIDRPLTVGPSVFGDNADIGVMLHNGTPRAPSSTRSACSTAAEPK